VKEKGEFSLFESNFRNLILKFFEKSSIPSCYPVLSTIATEKLLRLNSAMTIGGVTIDSLGFSILVVCPNYANNSSPRLPNYFSTSFEVKLFIYDSSSYASKNSSSESLPPFVSSIASISDNYSSSLTAPLPLSQDTTPKEEIMRKTPLEFAFDCFNC
jgi:hypothetical protein